MEKKKFSINVLFSVLNSLISLLFPLITYPYVSRILMPEGIGRYSIAVGIISYFMLFASLGVPLFGTKMVAKYKDDDVQLKKVCSTIFTISFITTSISFFIYFLLINFVFKGNYYLNLIVGFQLFSYCFNVEWYFQGIEQFRFITIRNLIVKIISIILIFIFVNSENDLNVYAGIMVLSVLLYSFVNLYKFFRDIKPKIHIYDFKKIIKPLLLVFLIYSASKLNSNLDVIMLGFIGKNNDYNVGIYTNATKVINIFIDLIVAVNLVIMPRIVSINKDTSEESIKKIYSTLFSIILIIALILLVGLFFVSKEIIVILSGNMYKESIFIMKIMCPNIIFITLINFFGVQVLYSNGKELKTSVCIFIGTVVNFILNFFLIRYYTYTGASIATIASNFIILSLEYYFCCRTFKISFFNKKIIYAIISILIMTICVFFSSLLISFSNLYLSLLFKICIGAISFLVSILVFYGRDIKLLLVKKNEIE